MEPIDLAWAAGFIDGEGSIHIQRYHDPRKRSPRYMARLQVGQVDPRPLLRLQAMFGGRLYLRRAPRPNSADSYSWEIGAHGAIAAVRAVRPFLIVKREAADVMLEFASIAVAATGRTPISQELTERREQFRVQIMEANRTGPRVAQAISRKAAE